MKAKFIIPFLCALPMVANAAIPYRVEQVKMPDADAPAGLAIFVIGFPSVVKYRYLSSVFPL